MVDLDSSNVLLSTSASLFEEDSYGTTDEFLLNNLLLFALRKGFIKGAKAVLELHDQLSSRPPPLAKWCFHAMKQIHAMESSVANEGQEHDTTNDAHQFIQQSATTDAQRTRLEVLLTIAEDFLSHLDQSSPYRNALRDYTEKARRLVVHMHLEQFAVTGDHAAFLVQINRHFPAASSDPSVRNYRFKFSKLLLSPSRTRLYLRERWLPNRIEALNNLSSIAWEVAQQFPEVLIDKLSTEDWSSVDAILIELNTPLALVIREYFRSRCECVEPDLVQIAQFANSQSIPSQLF